MSYAKLGIHIVWLRSPNAVGEVLSRHRTLESSATYWANAVKEAQVVGRRGVLRTVDTHNGSILKEWP